MRLRYITLLLTLATLGFLMQQFLLYLGQMEELKAQRSEVGSLRSRIVNAMYEEAQLRDQLHQAEQQHARLRRLLPESLQLEALEQTVATLATEEQLRVIASKSAVTSRPHYSEAAINITLEGKEVALQRFMRKLKAIPRRIHISPPEKPGKRHHPLTIYVYAVDQYEPPVTTLPACREEPQGVWLAPLNERLIPLFQDYQEQCQFVTSYLHVYRQQQELQTLQRANARLAAVEQQLRDRP